MAAAKGLPRTALTHGPKLPAARGRALVTGASSGIGWACAEALRDAGFEVIGTSRKGAGAPHPGGIEMVALDMGDPTSIAAAADRVLEGGAPTVVVANAGESQSGPFEELPADALNRVFQVNVLGQVDLVQRLLPGMRAAGRGRVILVGSMLGSLPLPHRSSYVATKAALRGFGLALRGEVSRFGIGVTVVEPGSINTGISTRRTKYGAAEGSPYREDTTTMVRNLDANEAKGISAEEVAETITREITADRPLPLVARGSRAGLVVPLTRILPTEATLALMRRVHGLK
ncbi:SDR family oxidoreductase [Corynebacterium hansenii]|uniref:SDR family oxidoreductase n=1 Tax=Corynebacterium hansenii TaxID=394964 RepID=A0ABV7ZMU8_9CORY|nr:SDR family oxidoreductase [Corynebacterium hansenii]WJY98697.1 3-oxoacyl-[acyl-carrier-protein] reductase FabG [Corynebacterium hansenii]